MDKKDFLELAEACCASYRKNREKHIDKLLLTRNLEAFNALIFYADREFTFAKKAYFERVFDAIKVIFSNEWYPLKSQILHQDYYLGNLIKTGRLEGEARDTVGLLPEAIERTRSFIAASEVVKGAQAEIISRCLKVALEKETFVQSGLSAAEILRPYEQDLRKIVAAP